MSELCESWRSSRAALKRILPLSCPSFSYCLRRILANNHRSHCKEPRNRVNVAFLRIGGGVYQSWVGVQ